MHVTLKCSTTLCMCKLNFLLLAFTACHGSLYINSDMHTYILLLLLLNYAHIPQFEYYSAYKVKIIVIFFDLVLLLLNYAHAAYVYVHAAAVIIV